MEKRELKFRAYSNRNKKMYDVFSFCNEFIKVLIPEYSLGKAKIDISEFEPLMQYTGEKDFFNEELFEFDILENSTYKYEIVFEKGSFVLYHINIKDFDGSKLKWGNLSSIFEADRFEYFKKIGNIYENPELLNFKN